nr:hypothetical protein [Chlamydiifrater phoenicopteri]
MNQTSAPSTTASNNMPLSPKGDASLTQEGSLKTQVGTLVFSSECPSDILESSLQAMQTICSQSILENAKELFAPSRAPLEQAVVFLSPETVSLEIEVKDLLLELQKPDTKKEETSNKPTAFSKGFVENPLLLPNNPVSKGSQLSNPEKNTTSPEEKVVLRTSEQKNSPSSGKDSPSLFSPASQKAAKPETTKTLVSTNKDSSPEKLAPSEVKTVDQNDSQPTTKASSSQSSKDQREGASQQEQHRHSNKDSEENSEEDSEELKIEKSEKKPTSNSPFQTLEINHLLFQYQKNSSQSKDSRSPSFQKKSSSPMAFFASNLSEKSKRTFDANITATSIGNSSSETEASSNENIFLRFMKLMARILGQAEAEAHELYLKVKARTDDVESLTLLMSKVNASKGDIDWSKNPEMIALVDKAKQLGVVVPNNNYKWTEEEKKMFRENIQMRKENMEKITQLERTDMQRLLQEVSQCHQARSNVLKLLKELMDTFIYNLRP